jgi:hypothetical protein
MTVFFAHVNFFGGTGRSNPHWILQANWPSADCDHPARMTRNGSGHDQTDDNLGASARVAQPASSWPHQRSKKTKESEKRSRETVPARI